MSVTSVKELVNSGAFVVDNEGKYTFVRTYHVFTDDVMGPQEMLNEAVDLTTDPLPNRFDTYSFSIGAQSESDPNLVALTHRSIRSPDNPKIWIVEVEYETQEGWSLGAEGELSVTFYLPVIRFFFTAYTKPIETDIDGGLISNSANVPFNPKKQIDAHRLVVNITRNETNYDTSTAIAYQDAINSDTIFTGVTQFQAKMTGISATRRTVENQLYWEVNYEIQFNADNWLLKLADQGLYELGQTNGVDVPGTIQRITDKLGLPVQEPMPMDGAGHAILDGSPAAIIIFHIYKEKAFALLDLPPLIVDLSP